MALTLLLIGGAGAMITTSIADFTAQTSNAANAFSSGTIVLSNAKTGGTTCLSTGGSSTDTNSNSTGCDNLISATGKKPGDAATTSVVTVRNVGTIAPASFKLFTTASTGCTSGNASGEPYNGTGNLCTVVALTIHDDTNNRCYYPTQTAGACTLDTTKTLSTFVASHGGESNALVLSTTGLSGGIAYTISSQLISTAENAMQGRTATINFDWKVAQ